MRSLRTWKNVVKRRGGIIATVKLEYTFWKIGRDKYVKMSRKKYGKS